MKKPTLHNRLLLAWIGLLLILLFVSATYALTLTTRPDGTVVNSTGQIIGKWERDPSGNFRLRDNRTGKLSDWKIGVSPPGGGTMYLPSPFDMPPPHPGLPNPRP